MSENEETTDYTKQLESRIEELEKRLDLTDEQFKNMNLLNNIVDKMSEQIVLLIKKDMSYDKLIEHICNHFNEEIDYLNERIDMLNELIDKISSIH